MEREQYSQEFEGSKPTGNGEMTLNLYKWLMEIHIVLVLLNVNQR